MAEKLEIKKIWKERERKKKEENSNGTDVTDSVSPRANLENGRHPADFLQCESSVCLWRISLSRSQSRRLRY